MEEFADIREQSNKLKMVKRAERRKIIEGVCEECGNNDALHEVNGVLLCENCENSI